MHLRRLAPGLRDYPLGRLISRCPGAVDLALEIEAQAPYTTSLRLTHLFAASAGHSEPDARLRVYHDARQVEILSLRQSILPLRVGYAPPALSDKWRANLFLSKWLQFCCSQGHGFAPTALDRSSCAVPADRLVRSPS
ncbi:DUF1249 domain-containing protein [Caldichromatium japonicum]|uniref:DUF1249 domain-containing protein n=2 Tax=Caldichromatium japonicum TaxID=2699430 RepID=A0A6G7VH41_9GAMM|nr:DUF1249 domain-containing protein [Caldichromatium japonicum]